MRRLIVGPWVGEFGWELMSWQGWARRVSQDFDEVVVCSRPGHELLSADFADRYITHNIDGVKDCYRIRGFDKGAYAELDSELNKLGGTRLRPGKLFPLNEQAFIKYGVEGHVARYDVLIHARKEIGKRRHHSYPRHRWEPLVAALISRGITVAAIGTEAFLPFGALDLRGLTLKYVADTMAACKLVIGPSSGPMHLASLCCTPHVVWTDQGQYSAIGGTNRLRYERLWNPFNTPVRVIDRFGWHPPEEDILSVVLKELGL
jgi:hypothetical protein